MKKPIENLMTARSAWDKGVNAYAVDLIDDYLSWADAKEIARVSALNLYDGINQIQTVMMNGADSWTEYSYGGCALIYDCDIASRLCTPSEFRRKRGGELEPNSRETWLDVQARALRQAGRRASRAVYESLKAQG